jgi:hypothetical protein
MEEEKTTELKNKITELKQRLNQMYAQYFSDTREGKAFETEFSLYVEACEHARREKSEHLRQQYQIMKTGMIMLISSAAFILFLFKQHILLSTVFLLGLGFFACGFMYLVLSAEIRIARTERFCTALARYFQQYRWSSETKQNLHLPEIPLWEEYTTERDAVSLRSRHCENQALYTLFRIAISFIDMLALVVLIQAAISGDPSVNKVGLIVCFIVWFATVLLQMSLVYSLLNHAEAVRAQEDKDSTEGIRTEKMFLTLRSWTHLLRLFFLLDSISPKAPRTGKRNEEFPVK